MEAHPGTARVTLGVFSTVLVFGLGHLMGITTTGLLRGSLVYDFRFYSMLLVGGLMIAPSIFGLLQLPGLRRGQQAAWRNARRASAVLLAVNVPMIPMQNARTFVFFGSLVASLAALHWIWLSIARRHFAAPT